MTQIFEVEGNPTIPTSTAPTIPAIGMSTPLRRASSTTPPAVRMPSATIGESFMIS